MPFEKLFKVAVVEKAHLSPVVWTYRTCAEAMKAANTLKAILPAKQGGQISVHDPDGKELQSWKEHPLGAHFTQPGGFKISP